MDRMSPSNSAQRAQVNYSADEWNREYGSGVYRDKWSLDWPTADLVATVSALRFHRGLAAVDLGCGSGSEALYLASKGFRVTAIDLSPVAVQIARQRARVAELQVDFRVASVFDLPVAAAAIDFANDRGCLHSLPHEAWPKYAKELARVLKPGGYALIRGSSNRNDPSFATISSETIEANFDASVFEHLAIDEIRLCASHNHLVAALVLLQRR